MLRLPYSGDVSACLVDVEVAQGIPETMVWVKALGDPMGPNALVSFDGFPIYLHLLTVPDEDDEEHEEPVPQSIMPVETYLGHHIMEDDDKVDDTTLEDEVAKSLWNKYAYSDTAAQARPITRETWLAKAGTPRKGGGTWYPVPPNFVRVTTTCSTPTVAKNKMTTQRKVTSMGGIVLEARFTSYHAMTCVMDWIQRKGLEKGLTSNEWPCRLVFQTPADMTMAWREWPRTCPLHTYWRYYFMARWGPGITWQTMAMGSYTGNVHEPGLPKGERMTAWRGRVQDKEDFSKGMKTQAHVWKKVIEAMQGQIDALCLLDVPEARTWCNGLTRVMYTGTERHVVDHVAIGALDLKRARDDEGTVPVGKRTRTELDARPWRDPVQDALGMDPWPVDAHGGTLCVSHILGYWPSHGRDVDKARDLDAVPRELMRRIGHTVPRPTRVWLDVRVHAYEPGDGEVIRYNLWHMPPLLGLLCPTGQPLKRVTVEPLNQSYMPGIEALVGTDVTMVETGDFGIVAYCSPHTTTTLAMGHDGARQLLVSLTTDQLTRLET